MVRDVRPHPLKTFDGLDDVLSTDTIQIKQGVPRSTARNFGHGQHTHGDPSLLCHGGTDSLTNAPWNYKIHTKIQRVSNGSFAETKKSSNYTQNNLRKKILNNHLRKSQAQIMFEHAFGKRREIQITKMLQG